MCKLWGYVLCDYVTMVAKWNGIYLIYTLQWNEISLSEIAILEKWQDSNVKKQTTPPLFAVYCTYSHHCTDSMENGLEDSF